MPRDGDMAPAPNGQIEWFTVAELAALALPGLPVTPGKIRIQAERERWERPEWAATHWRQRAGRGGGTEYHLAVLPMLARAKLVYAASARAEAPPPAEGLWEWFARQPETKKTKARERVLALDGIEALVRAGEGRVQAARMIARAQDVALSSLYAWQKLVHNVPRADWLPALAPRNAGGRGDVEMPAEAWTQIKSDFLRPERPNFTDCYRRLEAVAAREGWALPALRTLERRMMDIPEQQRVLARDGVDALRRMFPAQQRDRGVFHALEAVNADGHTWDVFVRWPDGTIGRPHMCAFQDLYSGKIVSWRVDQALTWHSVRLAFGDVVERFGIPRACWLDNGREFAAKRITGGQANRYRFKLREEEPEGLMTALGVEVHWTTPYHGQAKPIERGFRDFAQGLAKHPAFAGAYTGNNPTAKPDNYGKHAVPLDAFLAVVSEGIAEHNARAGRRSPTCEGRSFDATFDASFATAAIRRATSEQRRLWLLAAEAVRVRTQDGCIHFYGNRYWSDFLLAERGRPVTVRFDPDALADALHVYATDGRYLGAAECQEAAGFDNVAAAQEQARRWKQFLRATKTATELQDRMSIAEVARRLPKIEAAEPPEPRVVRAIFNGSAAVKVRPEPEEQQDSEDRVMAALRAHAGARPPLRLLRAEPEDEDEF